jgi:hypothetical protein
MREDPPEARKGKEQVVEVLVEEVEGAPFLGATSTVALG